MKKSIRSVFLAFVLLTVVLSGCAPASTPVPSTLTFTPIPRTDTPVPTATPTELPSPTASQTPKPLLTVKVMSYNILFGAGVDREFDANLKVSGQYAQFGRNRLPELLSAIKELDPDILGIQEGAGWDRGTPPVVQKVAEELDMNYFLAKAAVNAGHLMIFSKFKIVEAENLSPEIGNVGALRVKLTTPDGQPLIVFVVHLDFSSRNHRARQINTLVQYIQSYLPQRVLIMGDFNNNHGLSELENLREIGMIPVYQFMGIDEIWISPNLELTTTDWLKSYSAPNISDHSPIVAEIAVFPNTLSLPTVTPVPPTPIYEPTPTPPK